MLFISRISRFHISAMGYNLLFRVAVMTGNESWKVQSSKFSRVVINDKVKEKLKLENK